MRTKEIWLKNKRCVTVVQQLASYTEVRNNRLEKANTLADLATGSSILDFQIRRCVTVVQRLASCTKVRNKSLEKANALADPALDSSILDLKLNVVQWLRNGYRTIKINWPPLRSTGFSRTAPPASSGRIAAASYPPKPFGVARVDDS